MAFPEIIDSSMRATFISCPEKFRWAYVRHLESNGGNVHLHSGGCFADGIHAARQAYYFENRSVGDSLAAGAAAIIKSWGDPGLFIEEKKNLPRILIAFDDYFQHFPLESDPIRPIILPNKAGSEYSFALETDVKHPESGMPILFAGRMDMLATFNDTLWVVDEKTTARLGSGWSNKWLLRGQFSGYCLGALTFGHKVAGVIVRGIGLLENETTFQQTIVYRTETQIERWWWQFNHDLRRMVEYYETFGLYNRWPQALDEPCALCPYTALCLSIDPEELASKEYAYREWNPLKGDE